MKRKNEKEREQLYDDAQSQELQEPGNTQVVTDYGTPYNEFWRNRTVSVPGQNPFNGKTYGDVIDLVSSEYGENLKKEGIDPYNEARAQIMQSGIVDDTKPEDADNLALDIRHRYATQYGAGEAKRIVSSLPDQVPDIDNRMDALWYDRSRQKDIGHSAKRLGLRQENYVNYYVKPQIAKQLSSRYGYDEQSARHIAGRLMSQEQYAMDRVRQNEAAGMIGQYAAPKIQEYFDKAVQRADKRLRTETNGSMMTPYGNAGQMMGAAIRHWQETDPARIWEDMKPDLEIMGKDIVRNPYFISDAEAHADEEGMELTKWMEQRILPAMEQQIQAQFERMAIEREMPKNFADYMMAQVRTSLIGTLATAALESQARRRAQGEALQRTESGQGGYQPGFAARVAGGAGAMLTDMMLPFGGPFGLTAKFATKPVAGMARGLMVEGVRPVLARMAQSAASGSLSLGAFEGIKGGVVGALDNKNHNSILEEDNRSAEEILGDIVQGSFEHGMKSAATGATMVGGPIGQKVSNGHGLIRQILGFGTQVGIDAAGATAASSIPRIVDGEFDLEDLGRNFAENIGTFAALGAHGKAKEFASLAHGGRSWNGVEFTKEEIASLEDRYMQPLRMLMKDIEAVRPGQITRRVLNIDVEGEERKYIGEYGENLYRDLMHSYAVPRELKVKVAQALGTPVPEYALKPPVLESVRDVPAWSVDLGWVDMMDYEHNRPGGIADKVSKGKPLTDFELTLRLAYQDNKAYSEALRKQSAGEALTPEERQTIAVNQERFAYIQSDYYRRERNRIISEFERENGLKGGTIEKMLRDVRDGKAVDSNILNDFEDMLDEYSDELSIMEEQKPRVMEEQRNDDTKPVAEPVGHVTPATENEERLNNNLKDTESGNKALPLQERPLLSSDRWTGEHVEGLEEYEERLRKELSADEAPDSRAGTYKLSTPDDYQEAGRKAATGTVGADGRPQRLTPERRMAIEAELEAIRREKERRNNEWNVFRDKYNVSEDGTVSTEDYVRAFDDMNTDASSRHLMDRVLNVLDNNLGVLSFRNIASRGDFSPVTGDVRISSDLVTRGVDSNRKASTLLHELIHKVTADNIDLYEVPVVRHLMGKDALEACKELYAIHDALSKAYPDVYGSKSVKEMVADMGKSELRDALSDIYYDKNANVTWWDRFKNAVKKMFGFGAEEDIRAGADKDAMTALETLLDNYNEGIAVGMRTARKAVSRIMNGVSQEESELTPEDRQYWKQWDADMRKWKEQNGMPADAEMPEKPVHRTGTMADYVKQLMQYDRDMARWKTAPRLEDYRRRREEKDIINDARENEQRYPESKSARMRRIAAEFQQVRGAMSRQRSYDKDTVKAIVDFAQNFMRMGFGDGLSRGEVERMLSSVKNAAGMKDITKEVDNIMNILLDNHLKNLEDYVFKLASVKELKQTAQGIETQGRLELKGQQMIKAFREAVMSHMTPEDIQKRMAEIGERMAVARPDFTDIGIFEQEWEGLNLALQYARDIGGSRSEHEELRQQYENAKKNYTFFSYQARQEYLEKLEKAMLENKMERIGMYDGLTSRLEGNITESMKGARDFVAQEMNRIRHIHQIANYDIAGKDLGTFGAMRQADWKKRLSNNNGIRFFLGPLATFEQMLKQFGGKNANGEGYLYDHFMRTWMDATDKAYQGESKAKEELDAKAREVFGDKVKRWSDLYKIARSLPKKDVEVNDNGVLKKFNLHQGNLLYIYMANKMNDGAMKLRKMEISEEDVEKIKEALDPRLIQLADWLQEEYLPRKRTEYNKVYERMFGAPMGDIAHYFPLRILSDARVQDVDVANGSGTEVLPSTITGNIIKRRRNTQPLDILNTDALSLAIEHIEDMERWAAHAEWNRDINTLLSYTNFRNAVKNKNTIYGSGDQLWDAFRDTALMAAGTYNPRVKSGTVDTAISNIAKGVTTAKVNFRLHTALKQLLSAQAFLHDTNIRDFVNAAINPQGSWEWAMENMPVFRKRWRNRQTGDTRLMDDPTDWKLWKTNLVKTAARWGMTPNALVDGITCAVGARAIYESRLKTYQKMGMNTEGARKRALQDAEIGYNLTQQSSEGAFVSTIQKDRTLAANMLSVFRNSSMAYTRQWVDAARNLKHRMQKDYRKESIEFMTRQFEDQLGLDEAQVRHAAEAEYAKAARRDVARLLNMMYGVTISWNLGASLPYLLFGDDDETKEEMMTDALLKGIAAGPTEGLAAGNIISDIAGLSLNEQTRKAFNEEGLGAAIDEGLKQIGDYEINPLPLMSDIQGTIEKMGYDKYAAAQDLFNIAMQSLVGFNPQTFTDIWNAAIDYGNPEWMPFVDNDKHNQDLGNAKEIALFIMRVMNTPISSWRNKYIDELGMGAEEAQKLSYEEMAERYANYKHWKDAPFMGWLRSDEERQKKMESIRKQFDKAVSERAGRMNDDDLKKTFENTSDIQYRKLLGKEAAKRADGEDAIMSGRSRIRKKDTKKAVDLYLKNRDWRDMEEDIELTKAKREAEAANKQLKELKAEADRFRTEDEDGSRAAAAEDFRQKHRALLDIRKEIARAEKDIKALRDAIGTEDRELSNGDIENDEYRWSQIRKIRKEILEKIQKNEHQ